MSNENNNGKKRGSVLVVGGGIGGMQAALDLGDSGFLVHMVEKDSSIGGTMVRLDKTFPTGDCAMCMISPKMVEVGRHPNINIMSMSEVVDITGEPGNFKVKVRHQPRSIDTDKCTGCGTCTQVCPVRNVIQIPEYQPPPPLDPDMQLAMDEALEAFNSDPAALISILQHVNEKLKYLPVAVLTNLSKKLMIPEAHILSVATFYNAFSLVPVGRHIIELCSGTACHVRGAGRLLDRLREELQVDANQTTKDDRFTLRTVNCIGCCALAPAMRVDGEVYGYVKVSELPAILADHP